MRAIWRTRGPEATTLAPIVASLVAASALLSPGAEVMSPIHQPGRATDKGEGPKGSGLTSR